jgi:hypothetical protein
MREGYWQHPAAQRLGFGGARAVKGEGAGPRGLRLCGARLLRYPIVMRW